MKQILKAGSTSQDVTVFIQKSTDGTALTGLAYNTSGLKAYYRRPGGTATAITLATQTAGGAFSSGGFVEIDAANMPGVYRLDVPDAVFASGKTSAVVTLSGAANMQPKVIEFELTAIDPQDGTRGGMTALPNAAANAAGGLAATVLFAGTCQAGSTTTQIKLAAALSVGTDTIAGQKLTLISGTGANVSRSIISWDNTTKLATVDAVPIAPDATTAYVIESLGLLPITDYATADSVAAISSSMGSPAQASDATAILTAITALGSPAQVSDTDAIATAVAGVVTSVMGATVDGAVTHVQVLRALLAAVAGKANNLLTAPAFRDAADTKNRITFTMAGAGATRTPTLDLS